MIDTAMRETTLARFEEHRQAWRDDEALRTLYKRWYERVREKLPPHALGPWVELGSGPGFAKGVIPELELSDVVRAPWHQHEVDAEALPFDEGSIGALVLFDVLHHLQRPASFFAEAIRVLRSEGRVVMCEPYVSVLSFPVYRLFHEERLDFTMEPLDGAPACGDDPFDGNQAIPTQLFVRRRAAFERRFPELRIREVETLAGPAYPASGGFSRRALLPMALWRATLALEERLPKTSFWLIGFRLLAVLERR
jgi:SAM-dependent methyltransferase